MAAESKYDVTQEHLVIELEWHIPWDAGWPVERKVRAAEKLIEYLTRGTFFETAARFQTVEARIGQLSEEGDPFILIRLER